MSDSKNADANRRVAVVRRGFLRGLGVTAGGAAAAPLLGQSARADETPEEQAKGRYQDNEHAKRFYALNRL
jgi:hypothetical protein